ncbi:MAG: protein phosphatase CheZ [Syntrophobacteraceae bacterium]|jgi:chemotaxis protein CheZ
MTTLEPQDWNELVGLLKDTEESLSALSVGDGEKEMEKSRRSLLSFHSTAAMLGLESLAKAGLELQEFLTCKVSPDNIDSIAALGFAVSSLADQMRTSKNGGGNAQIDLDEILDILGPSETTARALDEDELPLEFVPEISGTIDETRLEALDGTADNAGFSNLSELVRGWGGELSVTCDGASGYKFNLAFSGSAESLKRIEMILSARDPSGVEQLCPAGDAGLEKVIARGKEFMDAFSSADLPRAQEILLNLADHQNLSSGLYKEIGSLARGLHDSIRGFLSNLDPSLQDIVEDKLPDSGNRLEHMMEMTEKAAITTLDHVEAMQERLSSEVEQISSLRALLGGLNAISDSAGRKLAQGSQVLDAMETIIGQHRSDLDIILTAQDYQDLSGQIILKITQLLKDMELKLVNLIRTFGVKTEARSAKTSGDLYGPAHAAVENAVQSQDEVDSLLADFGF